ncbi:MAG TPA: Rieske 2Fe-2S domain-containing protein [Gemmataceae bacterium]|nr:Rieske 2Fe-2S domain-containing protein [Gemmataceae bacterium]
MGVLDHWHPAAPSRKLRRRPIAVSLCDRELVLFRTRSGAVGALDDCCPHRRSKLSTGFVDGERLRCAYHAWGFGVQGDGESPGHPKLTARMNSYDTREAYGYVWVKARGAEAPFPELDADGYTWIGVVHEQAPAPLELVVDNFNELEHAGVNHTTFGFDQKQLSQVRVQIEASDDETYMLTKGATKPGVFITRWFIGYGSAFHFCSDTRTRYSPVHSRIDHWWETLDGAREARVRWRVYLFYVPVDAGRTDVVLFVYGKMTWPGGWLLWPIVRPIMQHEFRREIRADAKLLGNLADYAPGMEGMKLSRFDRILGLTRERIKRIYRGQADYRTALPMIENGAS